MYFCFLIKIFLILHQGLVLNYLHNSRNIIRLKFIMTKLKFNLMCTFISISSLSMVSITWLDVSFWHCLPPTHDAFRLLLFRFSEGVQFMTCLGMRSVLILSSWPNKLSLLKSWNFSSDVWRRSHLFRWLFSKRFVNC